MRVTIDLPDDLVSEVEQRKPNATWQSVIVDAITFAMAMADAASSGTGPSDDEVGRLVTPTQPSQIANPMEGPR